MNTSCRRCVPSPHGHHLSLDRPADAPRPSFDLLPPSLNLLQPPLTYSNSRLPAQTFHDLPSTHQGSPIYGGTNLTLVGSGFDQAAHVLPDSYLRCHFDPDDGQTEVLAQSTPVHFRNATHVVCTTPPSLLGRPPYLMHGAPLHLLPRTTKLRLALNGLTASVAHLPMQFYHYPNISAILPASGPLYGGTLIAIYGDGLLTYAREYFTSTPRHHSPSCFSPMPPPLNQYALTHTRARSVRYVSPWGRALCRFGDTYSPLHVINDTAALCTSPAANYASHQSRGALVMVHITLNGVDYGTEANHTAYFEYYNPIVLHSVWPLGGAAIGGTVVTLRGAGFLLQHLVAPSHPSPDAPKCLFGTISHVDWVANTTELGTVPPTEVAVLNATNWAFLQAWTDSEATCVLPRTYAGVPEVPQLKALAIALNGQQFDYGLTLGSREVAYGAPPPALPDSASGDVVASSAGSGEAGSGSGEVGSGGGEFGSAGGPVGGVAPSAPPPWEAPLESVPDDPRRQLNFTVYTMPTITMVTPASGPAIGGNFVRVHGDNLDALLVPGVSTCRFGRLVTPVDGNERGSLSCLSPAAGVSRQEVIITLNGQDDHHGIPPRYFSFYANPWILSVQPNGAPVGGGTAITVRGYGLAGGLVAGVELIPRCKFCPADAWRYAISSHAYPLLPRISPPCPYAPRVIILYHATLPSLGYMSLPSTMRPVSTRPISQVCSKPLRRGCRRRWAASPQWRILQWHITAAHRAVASTGGRAADGTDRPLHRVDRVCNADHGCGHRAV